MVEFVNGCGVGVGEVVVELECLVCGLEIEVIVVVLFGI